MSEPVKVEAALPKATVLSYVAVADTPTRVRTTAARLVAVFGWILAAIALCALIGIVWYFGNAVTEYHHEVARMSRFPAYKPPSMYEWMKDYLRWGWDEPLSLLAVLVYFVMAGASMLASAGPVKRGRKTGCYVSIAFLVPAILFWIFVAVTAGSWATMIGFGIGEAHWQPLGFLLFMAMMVPLVIALLLCDVIAYLMWIARNPITEKPAVPFMPKRDA